MPEPLHPLLGRIDLTGNSKNPTAGQDGLVVEISASVAIGKRQFTLSSGGSNLVSLSNWSDPANPNLVRQLDLGGLFTTSIASFGNLFAIASTPESYDNPSNPSTPLSQIRFNRINRAGELIDVGTVNSGFLTDAMRFSANGRQLYLANEGQPNLNNSVDPVGSVSIISTRGRGEKSLFSVAAVSLPELNTPAVQLLGSGIRFSGKPGVTTSFAQDAEPEYLAAAGGYLFVTLQENNTVARINLATNKVDGYIGLGWVDYSQISVDLNDRDGASSTAIFNPLSGQKVVGLRMADGIDAWAQHRNVYFITANEGDAREYQGYLDERRDSSLGYSDVPGRYKLIVNNASVPTLQDQALVLSSSLGDSNPTNDFGFEPAPQSAATRTGTPVSFGSRSLSLFDGVSGQLIWDSWMTDAIGDVSYNTSLQNIAQFAGIYDDTRSDDKGVEPESVVVISHNKRRYAVGALERTNAGNKTDDPTDIDPVTQGGLLVVYDVTDVNNVDFVTYQKVSRSPEGLEVISASKSPTGRTLLGVSSEFDSNSVEFLDFGAILNNGKGALYLASNYANPTVYDTL